ncbi:hypothetical protein, partial [Mycobacterium sp.]|uniref:hypothetical protein n=1 Tax=Mycobacterium sp. TaxID=1785 RepID=UPI003A878A3E
MQVGTTVDYLVRKSLQINHGLEFEEELYCEKSLNLYLDHPEIIHLNYDEMKEYYPPKIEFF